MVFSRAEWQVAPPYPFLKKKKKLYLYISLNRCFRADTYNMELVRPFHQYVLGLTPSSISSRLKMHHALFLTYRGLFFHSRINPTV